MIGFIIVVLMLVIGDNVCYLNLPRTKQMNSLQSLETSIRSTPHIYKRYLYIPKIYRRGFLPLCGVDSYQDDMFGCLSYEIVTDSHIKGKKLVTDRVIILQRTKPKNRDSGHYYTCNGHAKCYVDKGTVPSVEAY